MTTGSEQLPANISESKKQAHIRSIQKDIKLASQGGKLSESFDHFVENSILDFDKSFIIQPVDVQSIRFNPQLRSALSKTADPIQKIYSKAAEFHNAHLVGRSAFDQEFCVPFNEDFSLLVDECYQTFRKAADFLSKRFLQKDRFKSYLFFIKEIITPLEKLVFRSNEEQIFLQAVLEPCLDFFAKQVHRALLTPVVMFTGDFQRPVAYKNRSMEPDRVADTYIQKLSSVYALPHYINFCDSIGLQFQKYRESLIDDMKPFDPDLSAEMLSEIAEITPHFIKGWDCGKHEIAIGGSDSAYIDIVYGLPRIYLADSGQKQSHLIKTNCQAFSWNLFTGKIRWEQDYSTDFEDLQVVGGYILERIYETFIELYSKASIRTTTPPVEIPDVLTHEDFTTYSHSAFDRIQEQPEENESEVVDRIERRVPSIRRLRFLSFMQNEHGCEVASGKGSEVKIWKPGTPIYVLGRHKRNPYVPTWLIKEILKRLDINEREWLLSLDNL